MKIWRDIVSTAIVGTERQAFAAAAESLAALDLPPVAGAENEALEVSLLKTAALLSVYRRAGRKSAADSQPAPESSADERQNMISPRAEHLLATLLAGNYGGVLPEFFELAALNERVLTARLLPAALDLGKSRAELQNLLLPALGERGRWLARHNEDWSWADAGRLTDEIWQTGTRDERLAFLRDARLRDAAEALRMLRESWPGEAARDRAALLAVLGENLGREDEEFLESVLQKDKSLDVRRVAFELLLKIPDSALVSSLTARAAAMLDYRPADVAGKARIEVVFPENFDREDKSEVLGVPELYLDERRLGRKAVRLAKLLHAVPPRAWTEKWSRTKEEIIEAARDSEWHAALLAGFKSSAIAFAEPDWLLAVLEVNGQNDYYQLANQIRRGWTNARIEDLIAALYGGKFKKGVGKDFAAMLLPRLQSIWSDDFTARVLDLLANGDALEDAEKHNSLTYCLLDSASRIAPRHLERFEEKPLSELIEKLTQIPSLSKRAEEFRATLQFRREMHESFQHED